MPLEAVEGPLDTYHADQLRPLDSTKNSYQYIFASSFGCIPPKVPAPQKTESSETREELCLTGEQRSRQNGLENIIIRTVSSISPTSLAFPGGMGKSSVSTESKYRCWPNGRI